MMLKPGSNTQFLQIISVCWGGGGVFKSSKQAVILASPVHPPLCNGRSMLDGFCHYVNV